MHAQDHNNYQKFKKYKAYETAYSLKEEGMIRYFGISFHDNADKILRDLNGGSNASYAIRFAASFPNMAMVLSGMSNMEQMR